MKLSVCSMTNNMRTLLFFSILLCFHFGNALAFCVAIKKRHETLSRAVQDKHSLQSTASFFYIFCLSIVNHDVKIYMFGKGGCESTTYITCHPLLCSLEKACRLKLFIFYLLPQSQCHTRSKKGCESYLLN